jgi:putative signal transducing protein
MVTGPELVYLTLVPNEYEAEILCALLRTEGIECDQRPTNMSVGMMDGMPGGGPREVVVAEDGLARAREIMAASQDA